MKSSTEYQPSSELIAAQLAQDPRIAQAKLLFQAALNDHQQKIKTIRPPLSSLKQSYEKLITELSLYRGAKLWFPYLGSGIGNGALVELADGSIKYDFICGIGVHYWGHNHRDLLNSGLDAALSNTVMQGNLQQNLDCAELISLLVHTSNLDHCFLTSSGAMANENALKIAFQKNFPANRILTFEHCFTGRTLSIAQITDKPGFREGLPINLCVDYVPFFDPNDPEKSTNDAIKSLKKYIARYPKQHAAMLFELVQGEGGIYSGSKEFFRRLMEILKEHHIAIIDDEVQSFGRTTELFAFQYFGLQDLVDIVTIGKLSQTCATLYRSEYKPRPGLINQTYIASTSAIKASLVIIKGLLTGNYFGPDGKIAKLHAYFENKLQALAAKHPDLIEGPYGIGSMIAFTPYKGDAVKVNQYIQRLFEAGVISFTTGGSDGSPLRVRFLIPVGAITPADIDQVMQIVENTLVETI